MRYRIDSTNRVPALGDEAEEVEVVDGDHTAEDDEEEGWAVVEGAVVPVFGGEDADGEGGEEDQEFEADEAAVAEGVDDEGDEAVGFDDAEVVGHEVQGGEEVADAVGEGGADPEEVELGAAMGEDGAAQQPRAGRRVSSSMFHSIHL